MATARQLHDGWTFTQLGGGEGTKDGEWLAVQSFPTTVHVELLAHQRIPDPVSTSACTTPARALRPLWCVTVI